jgi:Bacterial Ig-like domain (group 3)/FG-GAP-like repeat
VSNLKLMIAVLFLLSTISAGARTIKFASAKTVSSGVSNPGCVAVGDFNRDGRLDLAVTDHRNSVAVFLGKGDGSFAAPTLYTLDFYVEGCAAVADFNGDHKLDLMVVGGDGTGHSLALLTGKGDGSFNSPAYTTTALGGAAGALALGDLNNDHNLDVFIGGNGSSDEVFGNGKGSFTEGNVQNASGFSVTVGDFNRDGNLDVACTSPFTNSFAVLLGNGDGTFQAPQVHSGINEPTGITTSDFNHDKKLDLAVAVYNGASVLILLGNGDGTFQSGTPYFAGNAPGTVVSADFNKDGNLDLAASDYNGGGVSVLPGKGDGSFASPTIHATGNNPTYVAVGDFNNDGSADLAVTNATDNTVSILLNAAGAHVNLSSAPNPSTIGQLVIFTVKVVGTVTTSVTPTGKVLFKDGSTTLGSAYLSQGKATFTTSTLSQGTHKITAYYLGDTTFNPNVSGVRLETVN